MRLAAKYCWLALAALLSDALPDFDAAAGSVRDQRNTEALLKCLRPVLEPVGGAARIYYVGTCSPKGDLSAFPRLELQRPSKGAVGVAAVRQIVQNDQRVSVAKDQSGMIRINIGEQPSHILQTSISSLRLNPDEQYTPELAIIQIENTKEIEAARKPGEDAFERLGGNGVVVASILVNTVHEGPHLSARMKNVTLDQALDSVAKAFGAVVVYEEWRGPRGALHYSVDFQPVIGYAP